MKKQLLSFVLFFFLALPSFGQNILWEKLYGLPGRQEVTAEIHKLTDTTFAVDGVDQRTNGRFFYLKIDANGNYIWQKTGRTFLAGENVMAPTADGGFIIAGNERLNTPPNLASDLYLQKTNALGDTLWTQVYATPAERFNFPTKVLELSNGDFAVFGYAEEFAGGDYSLLRTDSSGNLKWYKRFKQGVTAYSASMLVNHRGNFVLSGLTGYAPSYISRPYLMEISHNGDSLKAKSLVVNNFNYDERIYRIYNNIIQTQDTGYVFSGYYDSLIHTSQSNYYLRGMVVKTDTAFNVQWSYFFQPPNNSDGVRINKVQEQPDGSLMFLANDANPGANKIYLVRLTSQGQFMSYQTYSSVVCPNIISPYDFTVLPDSSAIIVGGCIMAQKGYLARVKDIYSGSTILSTPELLVTKKADLQIYPNPTTDQLLISSDKPLSGSLTIYNLQGQKLWQQELDQVLEQQISLQHFAKGIYLLQYQNSDGNQISKRIMKL